ncbi:MAG: peroxidase family protein [Dehalococcoidia bacterium]
MQQENLYDVRGNAPPVRKGRPSRSRKHRWRTADGSSTDLHDPEMGVADSRFGRNVPPESAWPEAMPGLMEPNPRTISRELLARREFLPATSLNLLAAAWIQFQVHGWFSHGDNAVEDPFEVPLEPDDPWPAEERPMKIRRTRPDPTWHEGEGPPTFRSAVTHWWDASQIYGNSLARQEQLRSHVDGKLRMVESAEPGNPLLPVDQSVRAGVDLTGWNDNYWLGLSLLHTVFAREHNAICDRIKQTHPEMGDEEIFQTARLVNAALMAKIHTVEWTPALLDTPTLHLGMHANWHGALPRWMTKRLPHLGHAWSGILGSHADHAGVPYSLTEEFVTVYRMHPLVPDEFTIRSSATSAVLKEKTFTEIQGLATRALVESIPMQDLFYSFGRSHPGQITLHNYPNSLRDFRKIEGGDPIHIDLAAIDILRDRERGIPRYNEFRERLRLPRVASFEDLCEDPAIAQELSTVYGGDIDRLDTMVGMFAEKPPKGFAFSETAFRIFVLMASRRLSSDRFFTDDFRPEIYTKEGLDWVEENTFSSVLLRHFPELRSCLEGLPHAFAPWNEVKA